MFCSKRWEKILAFFPNNEGLKKYNKTSLPYCRVLRAKSFRSCFSALCVLKNGFLIIKYPSFYWNSFCPAKNVRWGCFEMQFSLVENIPWFCCVWCWLFKNRTRERDHLRCMHDPLLRVYLFAECTHKWWVTVTFNHHPTSYSGEMLWRPLFRALKVHFGNGFFPNYFLFVGEEKNPENFLRRC